jgi:hypothetical protein
MTEDPRTRSDGLPPALARQVDELCDRFEAACQAGQRPRIDDYLAALPEPGRAVLRRELLALERAYLRRHEQAACDQDAATFPGLDGFEFLRCLGKGAFGEVWLATDLNLRQERAVKLLPRGRQTPAGLAMLVDEARKMARLPRHRNRVQVHALIPGANNCFLVMEYVDGGPLSRQTSPQAPMRWERAVRHVADVADGLAEAHAAGLLHRDIKPANILWDRGRDEALLADFGIAAYTHEARGIAGTVGYIAPELDGGSASASADVFALAATLFHLVVGRPPFATDDLFESLRQARQGLHRPVPALRTVPAAVEDVILAGLEPDPNKRLDLPTFNARLRGAHLQALADQLLRLSRQTAARLRVSVATASETDLVFRPISCETHTLESTRDMEYVPEPAPVAAVRTGDLVRFEVVADADGYLTVLNLGSSGHLKVVFPNPLAPDNRVRAGQAQRLTVKLTPPAGIDRAAIIWTRRPGALTPAEWRSRIEAGQPATLPPEESTRGMDFVLHEAGEQPGDAWTAAVVAVAHRLPA